jgi:hypothetical protein
VPTDSRQQAAIDRILSSVRDVVEPTVRSYADEIVQTATAELRREADLATVDLRAALQRQEIARIDAESQVADLRRQLEAQKQAADEENMALRMALEAESASQQRRADAEIDEARRAAQASVDDMHRDMEARVSALTRQLAETEAEVAQGTALLESLRSLDEAGSLGGVLERLTQLASRFSDRAALLMVEGDRLFTRHLAGFAVGTGGSQRASLALDEAGVIGAAVRQGRMVVRRASDVSDGSLSLFAADSDRAAAAVPVLVSGAVVASLYVDAPHLGDDASPSWCHAIETLARYAGRTLEALTIQLALGFASPLVQPSHGTAPGHPLSGGMQ